MPGNASTPSMQGRGNEKETFIRLPGAIMYRLGTGIGTLASGGNSRTGYLIGETLGHLIEYDARANYNGLGGPDLYSTGLMLDGETTIVITSGVSDTPKAPKAVQDYMRFLGMTTSVESSNLPLYGLILSPAAPDDLSVTVTYPNGEFYNTETGARVKKDTDAATSADNYFVKKGNTLWSLAREYWT